jgi:hypothetical protein
MQRSLQPVIEQTAKLHDDLEHLWADLPEPTSRRALVALGYSAIVRQHVSSQVLLAQAGFDVPATTLVRPAYESLVRAIWCMGGADDDWIERFLSPVADAISSDGETAMGPNVQRMLDQIEGHHPAHLHQMMVELKTQTWRAMHSYVHGGIRPLVQSLVGFREHEVTGVVMNANAMFVIATNVARMACGLSSPHLPELQLRHAQCLPPGK